MHVKEITDKDLIHKLRSEGIRVDDEGYYTFRFGDNKEFEWCIEPLGDDGQFLIAIYKNRVPLNHKLPIWATKKQS